MNYLELKHFTKRPRLTRLYDISIERCSRITNLNLTRDNEFLRCSLLCQNKYIKIVFHFSNEPVFEAEFSAKREVDLPYIYSDNILYK